MNGPGVIPGGCPGGLGLTMKLLPSLCRRPSAKPTRWLAAAAVLSLAAASAAADPPKLDPPMADRVPADTIVYVGWVGAEAMGDDLAAARLGTLVEQQQMGRRIAKTIREFGQITGSADDEDFQNFLAAVEQLGPIAWRRPCAFYWAGGLSASQLDAMAAADPALQRRRERQAHEAVDAVDADGPFAELVEAPGRGQVVLEARDVTPEAVRPQVQPATRPAADPDADPAERFVDDNPLAAPRLGFFINLKDGKDHEVVQRWMVEWFDKLEADADFPFSIVQDGDMVGLVLGEPPVEDPADALAAAPRFARLAPRAVPDPAFTVYADGQRALELVAAVAAHEGDTPLPTLRQAWAQTGVDGVGGVLLTGGLLGRDWQQVMFVEAAEPRRGALQLLAGQPLDPAVLRAVPADATWVRARRTDIDRYYKLGKRVMTDADPGGPLYVPEAVAEVNEQLGFDYEQALAATGDAWVMYTNPSFNDFMGMGLAVVAPLDDPEKVDTALTTIAKKITAEREEDPQQGAMVINPLAGVGRMGRLMEVDLGDGVVRSLVFPTIAPSWLIADGRLYASLSAQATANARAFAQQASAEGGRSVLDNAKYQAVLARLTAAGDDDARRSPAPNDPAAVTGVMFADLDALAAPMHQFYRLSVSALLQMAAGFGGGGRAGDPIEALIPPAKELREHLAPAGRITWADAHGLYTRSVAPFPGALAMSPESAMFGGTTEYWVLPYAVASPFMAHSMHQSRVWDKEYRIDQMYWAARNAETRVNGELVSPARLHDLALTEWFDAGELIGPDADTTLPDHWADMEEDARAAWLQANATYVLLPHVPLEADRENRKLLAFERPEQSGGRLMAILWSDGETEVLPVADAAAKIKAATGKTPQQLSAAATQPTADLIEKAEEAAEDAEPLRDAGADAEQPSTDPPRPPADPDLEADLDAVALPDPARFGQPAE